MDLEPLEIIEDRTDEQKMKDGDWCDLPPLKLPRPSVCGIHAQGLGEFVGPAWWLLNGMAFCDECVMDMLSQLPDNREWLAEALADIRERRLKVGARVRILMGEEEGKLGTIYNHLPSRPAPWHVRPDGWLDNAGIAFKADELDIII